MSSKETLLVRAIVITLALIMLVSGILGFSAASSLSLFIILLMPWALLMEYSVRAKGRRGAVMALIPVLAYIMVVLVEKAR